MTSITRLPTVWPIRPWFHPGMTWLGVAAMVKPNGCCRVQEASNTVPLRQIAPTYCTTTVCPLATAGPVPLTSVLLTSLVGGLLDGILIFGAVPAAAVTVGSEPPPLDTCWPDADAFAAKFLIRSTTNTSVSVPLIPACGLPLVPNACLGGTTASTRLPIFCPISAVSRPGSSCPANSVGSWLVKLLCASRCEVPLQM